MDDANKIADSNQTVVPNQQPALNQNATSVATANPVGSVQKEQAPPISPKVKSELESIIEASEKPLEISQEEKETGVETVSDKPKLTHEHEGLMEHAGESTPIDIQPKLPMSENEALKIIKTTKNSDSRHWLAVLIEKIYKMLRN